MSAQQRMQLLPRQSHVFEQAPGADPMTPFRIVLCTGGRKFADVAYVGHQMATLHADCEVGPFGLIVHGGATGLDAIVDAWGKGNGVHTARIDALWDWYRKQGRVRLAGFARNGVMLKLPIDTVVAFPGGNGTANQVAQTQRRINNGAQIRLIELAKDYEAVRNTLDLMSLGDALKGLE